MVEGLLVEPTLILIVAVLTIRIIVVVLLLVVVVFIIISWGLNWKSDTFWQVWKWVDQLSLLNLLVIEGASVTKLAFSSLHEVLAWLGLVVGVDGTESSLSEVLWEWVIWLSQLSGSVSELAELGEWTVSLFHEMLAHLGLIFLLELVELTLVSVEVVIVVLLGEMSKNFTWWIVKVSWSAVGIVTLAFVSLLLASLGSSFSGVLTGSRWLDERGSSRLGVLFLGGFGRSAILNYFGVDWLK